MNSVVPFLRHNMEKARQETRIMILWIFMIEKRLETDII